MKTHETMAGTSREKSRGSGAINLIRGQLINQNRDPREDPRKILIDKAINLMSQNAPIPTTTYGRFPLGEIYFYLLIVSFLRFGTKVKRSVKIRHNHT